jgi:hypothetical protein
LMFGDHLFATVPECPKSCGAGEPRTGEVTMTKVLNEILLYFCVGAFVTGIVALAAAAFIS